jgi:hypothetical protein
LEKSVSNLYGRRQEGQALHIKLLHASASFSSATMVAVTTVTAAAAAHDNDDIDSEEKLDYGISW